MNECDSSINAQQHHEHIPFFNQYNSNELFYRANACALMAKQWMQVTLQSVTEHIQLAYTPIKRSLLLHAGNIHCFFAWSSKHRSQYTAPTDLGKRKASNAQFPRWARMLKTAPSGSQVFHVLSEPLLMNRAPCSRRWMPGHVVCIGGQKHVALQLLCIERCS